MNKKIKIAMGIIMLEILLIIGIYSYINKFSRYIKLEESPLAEEKILNKEELEPLGEKKIVRLLAAGDAMFHMPQVRAAYFNGDYDFNHSFRHIKHYVEASDIALINLETVVGGKELTYSGYPNFNSPVETLVAIKNAGFNIINTANNHILDRQKIGLLNTIKNIEDLDLKNLGSSRPLENKYLIENINDIKLGFLSYTYGCNGMDYGLTSEELRGLVNIIDEDLIKKDIENLRNQVDFIIVYIHWGNEYEREPSLSQIDLGEKILSWGGDIILGSHPHVIQRGERKTIGTRDTFIIYSLGNFISNQRFENMKNYNTEDGLMVRLDLEKDFSNGQVKIREIVYIPTWVNKYWKDKRAYYEILPITDILNKGEEGYKSIENKMKKSYNRTMEVLNKN